MNRFSAAILAICSVLIVVAQERPLPIGLAHEEITRIPGYRDSRAGMERGITTPPDQPVRTMAEWEEIQSLAICWAGYDGILKQIVAAAKTECEVIIICQNENDVISVLQDGTFGGPLPDLDNINFIQAPFNSVWMRDYGAECIYTNEVDSLYLLDWIYNRPRPEDDILPDVIGLNKGIGVYNTSTAPNDLVHTGGNFMADGAGGAFSSELVLDENGPDGQFNQTVKTEAQVDALMQTWMGITSARYTKMTTLPYDGIHHIDMHMKLIDEETLLVGEFPQGLSDGPQLETNLDAIAANETNCFGQPYRIVRIPMPSSAGGNFAPDASYRTYANNVFVNKTVIVPTYRTEYDTTGLRILRESLPGYRVVGIDCDNSGANIISASGAIHCITKGIGVADPLLIRHQKLTDTYETVNPYPVTAYIRHKSGITSASLFWSIDTSQAWNEVVMVDQGGNSWNASIPAQAANSTVFYYVGALANNGKTQVRPITAPAGWWKFDVLDISNSIFDPQGPAMIDVFPNPCVSHVVITLDHIRKEDVRIVLHDMLGRESLVLHNGPIAADGRILLDVSALPVGTYSLTVESEFGRATQVLVKR
ncbi:MAG: agmatine deiminase family protein [Flavobacteriales bacterium]|nr:agmatine deiminase family protein [Flavobacteriales bacterium]